MSIRRPLSPTSSAISSAAGGGSTSRNIVSKLVLRGSVDDGANGATIRLYAKVSVPEFPPAQAFPLFAEGSTRLVESVCHPLTSDGAPYAIPPKSTRLLRRAIRALNLPKPVSDNFTEQYGASAPRTPSKSRSSIVPISENYANVTGSIIVNNFEYCFHSPRVLLPPPKESGGTVRGASRRSSLGASLKEVPLSYHLIAMELFVPFASTPPQAPFMVNMGLPRCLQNSLRFELFDPTPRESGSRISEFSSGVSNASADDGGWDIRTIPSLMSPVRPRANSTSSHKNWADEESVSEDEYSSPNVSKAALAFSTSSSASPEIVRGTFPSSDRLIIRWAHHSARQPLMKMRRAGDSRKRVVAQRVDSNLLCSVRKPIRDGINPYIIPMRVEFDAYCQGITHPGVETSLAFDVVLDSFGSSIEWAIMPDLARGEQEIEVSGDPAVSGWSWDWDEDVESGAPPITPITPVSTDLPDQLPSRPATPSKGLASTVTPSSPFTTPSREKRMSASLTGLPIATNSKRPISSASLLRSPLPGTSATQEPSLDSPMASTKDDDDVSFRDGYFSSRALSRRSSVASLAAVRKGSGVRQPSEPFCIHVDLLPLITKSNMMAPNTPLNLRFRLTFELLLSGTSLDPNHIPLPTIRLPTAQSHSCHIALRSDDPRVGSEISVSAPSPTAGKRSSERIGSMGVSWDVDVSPTKWTESLSATVDDEWAEDCLLLVLPEIRKPRAMPGSGSPSPKMSPALAHMLPNLSSAGVPTLASIEQSPSSTTTMVRPSPMLTPSGPESPPDAATIITAFDPPTTSTTPTRRPGITTDPLVPPTPVSLPQASRPSPGGVPMSGGYPWVNVSISPMAPVPSASVKEKSSVMSGGRWSALVVVRVPWPSATSGQRQLCEFGFAKPEGSTLPPPTVENLHASIDGRIAHTEFFATQALGGLGSPKLVNTALGGSPAGNDQSAIEWLSRVRITDPAARYDGTLEFQYEVHSSEEGMKPINVLLPTFPLQVFRLDVSVTDSGAYTSTVAESNLIVTGAAPIHLKGSSLQPHHKPHLTLALVKPADPPRVDLFKLFVISEMTRLSALVDGPKTPPFLGSRTSPSPPPDELPISSSVFTSTSSTPTSILPDSNDDFDDYETTSTSSSSSSPASNTPKAPPQSHFPSIPFPDHAFDDLPNMLGIPTTTLTLTPTSAPTHTNYHNQNNPTTGSLGSPLGNPLEYILHFAHPRVLAGTLWRFIIMLWHYPLEPA
ncbi:hypothetical protein DL93DRAFT_2232993 [Clavulina sp. PMI_390]|nr:hypothetical protein DL93DRAFT_2232993 [Clavulina sp. PMI_390]